MFDRENQPTITESVVESADSAIEPPDSTTDPAADPVKAACGYGPLEEGYRRYNR